MPMRTLPRDFFFAVIVFTMLTAGTVAIVNEVRLGSMGTTGNPDLMAGSDANMDYFNSTFNIYENITGKTDEMASRIGKLTVDKPTDVLTIGGALVSTAWSTIVFVFSSLGMMNSAIQGISGFLSIPAWIPQLVISLIMILFIFSILTVVFGKEL